MSSTGEAPSLAPAPSLTELLTAHLGPEAALLPVTAVTWAPDEHVTVQGAVDRWLARNGAPYRLVADVSMTDQPSGPGDQTRSSVQAGLYLIEGLDGPDDGDRTEDPRPPLAFLLRGTENRGPQQDVSLEIACSDRSLAHDASAEIRRLATEFTRQPHPFAPLHPTPHDPA